MKIIICVLFLQRAALVIFSFRELNRPLGLGLDWLVWDGSAGEGFANNDLSSAGDQPADRADLLVDITPGEEGILRPNRLFTKKWILQNSGSTVLDNGLCHFIHRRQRYGRAVVSWL